MEEVRSRRCEMDPFSRCWSKRHSLFAMQFAVDSLSVRGKLAASQKGMDQP